MFHAALTALLPVFLLIILLSHAGQFHRIDWQHTSLSQTVQEINLPYPLFSLGITGLPCLGTVCTSYHYYRDGIRQLIRRQGLTRVILKNKWYEVERVQVDDFFRDPPSNRSEEEIICFPKVYYQLRNRLIHIRAEITLGKCQKQLLNPEKRLESGLHCELTGKKLKDSYVEHTLLYDTIADHISIEGIQARNDKLRPMRNVQWEYDKPPHMFITGGIDDGETYFILTLIETLLHTNAVLSVLGPENTDLVGLQTVMPDAYYKGEDMPACIDRFYEEAIKRSEDTGLMENYRTRENCTYLGLPVHFLIFDEYVVFVEMLGTKENVATLNKLKQIVMLGRQAGFFLTLACQRSDTKYLGSGIHNQFNFHTVLGRMSGMGYGMMLGETTKNLFLEQVKERSYVDVGTSIISELYTSLVPKEHDFLKEIKKLTDNRQGVWAACRTKTTETG